jgi:hypothetical protein
MIRALQIPLPISVRNSLPRGKFVQNLTSHYCTKLSTTYRHENTEKNRDEPAVTPSSPRWMILSIRLKSPPVLPEADMLWVMIGGGG